MMEAEYAGTADGMAILLQESKGDANAASGRPLISSKTNKSNSATTTPQAVTTEKRLLKAVTLHQPRSRGIDTYVFFTLYAFIACLHVAPLLMPPTSTLVKRAWLAAYFMPFTMLAHAITALSTLWTVKANVTLRYRTLPLSTLDISSNNSNNGSAEQQESVAKKIIDNKVVHVIPAAHAGAPALCPLHIQKTTTDGIQLFFVFQKTKFLVSIGSARERGSSRGNNSIACKSVLQAFRTIDFPTAKPLGHYLHAPGFTAQQQIADAQAKYGANIFDIPIPTFNELFKEHAVAPFFVFQVFCVALYMLDDYWYLSALTLFMLVVFEATVVKRRQKNLEQIRQMRAPPHDMYVYRMKKWTKVKSDALLPGDICSITRLADGAAVPCDLLMLRGTCVVNEAMLTGESVPQLKEAVAGGVDRQAPLDMADGIFKSNILFGGTAVVLHREGEKNSGGGTGAASAAASVLDADCCHIQRAPDHGCIAYVLRTGFNSSQGQLVRTIIFSTEHVGVNNLETLLFLGFLLIFAIISSLHVLREGLKDPTRSRFELFLHCTMIITAVVPPELPMQLSLAVNTSLIALAKQSIFCTEPFRIPLAGSIAFCCFDKTGTLTSDNFVVRGVAGAPGCDTDEDNSSSASTVTAASSRAVSQADTVVPQPKGLASVSTLTQYVIATCHSLALLDKNEVVGDPLEKSAFQALPKTWSLSSTGLVTRVASASSEAMRLRIVQRFAFSSALKRMSCIVVVEHSDREVYVVAKGAAEVMKERMMSVPSWYDACHMYYSRRGCRVLALGARSLGHDAGTTTEMQRLKREKMERDLDFAGFLVLQCPLKPKSRATVLHLLQSSHRVTMITGDHMLTACHVAKEVCILLKPALVLDEKTMMWQLLSGSNGSATKGEEKLTDIGREFSLDGVNDLVRDFGLCLSGAAFQHLLTRFDSKDSLPALQRLVALISVFARTSPDQKERILTMLKDAGYHTLMCGDGTNDVGALKQAHVGVALLTTGPAKKKTPKEIAEAKVRAKKRAEERKKIMQRKPKTFAEAMKQFEEASKQAGDDGEAPLVRLGDASIASPFTSKIPSVACTEHILRQGRCTLATTMQIFQILALNCLMTAYSLSVLFLDDVRFGQTMMVVSQMMTVAYFLFISRSQPLQRLSKERPHHRLFSFSLLLSVCGQFAIHLYAIVLAVRWGMPYKGEWDMAYSCCVSDYHSMQRCSFSQWSGEGLGVGVPSAPMPQDKGEEDSFEPNVLTTLVFLVSSGMTISTFLANYQGEPFMQPLKANRPFYLSLVGSFMFLLALCLDGLPDVAEWMELMPLPNQAYAEKVALLMIADLVGSFVLARVVRRIFAIIPKDQPGVSELLQKELQLEKEQKVLQRARSQFAKIQGGGKVKRA